MVRSDRRKIVTAESEANFVEGVFKTVNARLVLHRQTPFRAFSVQAIIAVHHFFYLIGIHYDLPPYARLESDRQYTFPLCSPELIQRIDTTADRRQEDAASRNGLSVVSAVKNGEASRRRWSIYQHALTIWR
ncbi:MAG: hypothetical protein ACXV5H_12340 [Halobacteriota archaeon]